MGARYYAAWLGRWTSADPMGIGADGPGLYNYTRGSPVNLTDPGGMDSTDPCKGSLDEGTCEEAYAESAGPTLAFLGGMFVRAGATILHAATGGLTAIQTPAESEARSQVIQEDWKRSSTGDFFKNRANEINPIYIGLISGINSYSAIEQGEYFAAGEHFADAAAATYGLAELGLMARGKSLTFRGPRIDFGDGFAVSPAGEVSLSRPFPQIAWESKTFTIPGGPETGFTVGGTLSFSVGDPSRTTTSGSSRRPFKSKQDPGAADVANQIEEAFPGAVDEIERGVFDADGNMKTDIDIVANNQRVGIQVKLGETVNLLEQLMETRRAGYRAVAYAPEITSQYRLQIERKGFTVATTFDELLNEIHPAAEPPGRAGARR